MRTRSDYKSEKREQRKRKKRGMIVDSKSVFTIQQEQVKRGKKANGN